MNFIAQCDTCGLVNELAFKCKDEKRLFFALFIDYQLIQFRIKICEQFDFTFPQTKFVWKSIGFSHQNFMHDSHAGECSSLKNAYNSYL